MKDLNVKIKGNESMSFTVFSYNATVLLIQTNPTQTKDGPNQCPSLRLLLFFSRPRSEGWPHHGRTFSIYL